MIPLGFVALGLQVFARGLQALLLLLGRTPPASPIDAVEPVV